MTRDEVDKSKITPMMRQYLEIKEENVDNILFFRLGDFYEMFFEDAITASNELELTLTGKSCGLDERVPMCGIPYHSATIYIEKLIEKGYKVAICEQTEDPKNAKGIVKRDIVQVITSGTRMNSDFIDDGSNNFIGAILDLKYCYVVCYCDITTGEVYSFIKERDNDLLLNEILERNIKEVVVNTDFDKMLLDTLKRNYNITISLYNNTNTIKDERVICVIKYMLSYLENTQKRSLSHLQPANIVLEDSFMKMNLSTKRNLELVENIRTKEKKYSLLWLLDKTKTAMGSRRLKSYILNPIVDKNKIEERQNIVETLMKEFILKDELREYLSYIYDLERLIGKISFGSANARDLLQLKSSFKVLPSINEILKKINYKQIDTFNDLYNLLENSIYEDAPSTLKEGYLIKEGYNTELDTLKDSRNEEKEKTGIKTLKVGYNRVFGYYIEVSKAACKELKPEYGYERKQTLANCERFITPLLKEKETLILGAEEKIINLEYDLFIEIRDTIKKYIPSVQELARTLSEIDVLSSFALVAEENNYIKPILNEENIIDIKDARHPVIEKVLINSEFVSNDIKMNKEDTILLITGPNMAGKSTYMRQMAIISIMAQIGSFVPASYANIPIFDKIFTRIGASDDLVSGESTFMVEMMEAGSAISNATKNSLILFDELGRGTATYDGMALAAAIIEYIHDKVGAKTFFSTHYHELTDLEKTHKHLKNVHVSAKEENGNLVFMHKIENGSVDKSYGIHVAKLANLPNELIDKASEILKKYEKESKKVSSNVEQITFDLVQTQKSKVEEELEKINPIEMTPIEAINTLYELKQIMKQ